MVIDQFRRPASGFFACLLVAAASGCLRSEGVGRSASAEGHGRHGGHLFETPAGADFLLEFTLDGRRRLIVIYVQDPDSREPYALAAETLSGKFEFDGRHADVTFAADPRPADPPDRSSRYKLSVDELPQQLLASDRFRLEIEAVAGDRTTTSTMRHENDHAHDYFHD